MKFSAPHTPPAPKIAPPSPAPKFSDRLASQVPQHLGGGKFWNPGMQAVTDAHGVALHPDTAVERARRGLPQMHPLIMGTAAAATPPSYGG